MSPVDLRHSVRAEPFEPFRLYLSDGTTHDVRHPEFFGVGVRTSFLTIPDPEDPEYAGYVIKVDNLHVTKVVPLSKLPADSPS